MWPGVADMANDLGESPRALIESRLSKQLPDPRHDPILLERAEKSGVHLTQAKIDKMRYQPKAPKRKAVRRSGRVVSGELAERRERIGVFVQSLGGYAHAADAVGMSENALRIAVTRGQLQRKYKHEILLAASAKGIEVGDDLFDRL